MNSLTKTLVFGSTMAAVATLSLISGCSSTASDSGGAAGSAGAATAGSSTAGSTSEAGASDGGTASGGTSGGSSTAGSGTSGGSTGEAGEGPMGLAGEGGATASTAVGKFCNEVAFGNDQSTSDITLRLEIGTPPNVVTFSALTGTCVPVDCKGIPTGAEVPVALFDPSTGDTMLDSATAPIMDGGQYVFWAAVGDAGGGQMAPLINGRPITDGSMCSAFTYADLP